MEGVLLICAILTSNPCVSATHIANPPPTAMAEAAATNAVQLEQHILYTDPAPGGAAAAAIWSSSAGFSDGAIRRLTSLNAW